MKKVFNSKYIDFELEVDGFIKTFDNSGEHIKDERNELKLFNLNTTVVNIKSFKTPNLINQVVYKFFRKSKAQRSYEYAQKLLELGVGTPYPIAYYEFATPLLFKKSFYVSEQLDSKLTYRELIKDFNYPNHEQILREFTRFTFDLHEKGIHFLDHSPGNTLIKRRGEHYEFFLVDLNRMQFRPMNFKTRMKNFARLTKHRSMVEVMSDEYAKCIGKDYNEVYTEMWKYTKDFRQRIKRKKSLKKFLKL